MRPVRTIDPEARNLTTQDGLPCDPFVVVECCGKRYQTDTKESKAMFVSWNEDNIWPDVELYPEEFESAYIEFSVYARLLGLKRQTPS